MTMHDLVALASGFAWSSSRRRGVPSLDRLIVSEKRVSLAAVCANPLETLRAWLAFTPDNAAPYPRAVCRSHLKCGRTRCSAGTTTGSLERAVRAVAVGTSERRSLTGSAISAGVWGGSRRSISRRNQSRDSILVENLRWHTTHVSRSSTG
jgi:hypothetical protein